MAVVIRLARFGKKHDPVYRITVADSRRYVTGKFLEVIGHYVPTAPGKPKNITLDMAKYTAWVQKGAQPSTRVQHVAKLAGAPQGPQKMKPGRKVKTAATPAT